MNAVASCSNFILVRLEASLDPAFDMVHAVVRVMPIFHTPAVICSTIAFFPWCAVCGILTRLQGKDDFIMEEPKEEAPRD